jgi:ABC-type branched-subunit amino acid transport system substrate-binding protein
VRRIYVSMPLHGPAGAAGRDILRGVELALERAPADGLALVALDASGDERDDLAVANARRAAEDGEAVAYIGDFHSSQVMRTAPILAGAGLLQVAPAATYSELDGPTLVRLMPDDRALARGIAVWVARAGIERVLVVHDHDDGYGIPVGTMCAGALRDAGVGVRARPVWDHDEAMADDLAGTGAVLYVGVAGSGIVTLWRDLHRLDPGLWLLATDGIAVDWLAEELDAGAATRTRLFTAQRAPWGFYGYEAAALALDAVTAAGGDRAGAVRAARATHARDSALGRYSIGPDGRTSAAADGRLAAVAGEFVWDRAP